MIAALAVAIGAVAIGAVLGFIRARPWLLGSIQVFAMVAALVVAFAHLLPDALGSLGLLALAVFAIGFALAMGFERLGHLSGRDGAGLEAGYLGLLIHKLGDGLAFGHFSSHSHGVDIDVLVALGAHEVPLTALVVIAFRHARGTRSAIYRALGLALAAVAGMVFYWMVPAWVVHRFEPWATAAVAGLLVHVVGHTHGAVAPSKINERAMGLVAVVAGLCLLLIGHEHGHHHGLRDIRSDTAEALLTLALETAPVLLIGLVLGAALQTLGHRLPQRWMTGGSRLGQALRGAVVGTPLPICACGVLPLAQSLRARGAKPALVVAFLLATPELGVETFALSVRFLGWPFAVLRLVAAIVVAIAAAWVLAFVFERSASPIPSRSLPPAFHAPEQGGLTRFVRQLDELLLHILPWTALGLLAAAYVEAALPANVFADWGGGGLDLLVVTLVAVPSYVCAASATPLAAVLVAKGISPGAVLVGLLLGPGTNLATAGWLKASFGARAAMAALAALVAVTWGFGMGLNASEIPIRPLAGSDVHEDYGLLSYGALGLLAMLSVRGVWLLGFPAWLGSLSEGLGGLGHGGHGHGGHGHGGHGHGGHGHGGHGHGGHGH